MNNFVSKNGDYFYALGRAFIGVLFLVAGLEKVAGDIGGLAQNMSDHGVPLASVLVYLVLAVEVLGGLALVIGLQTRWAALLLALFVILTIVFYHPPMAEGELHAFLKNLAITGGLFAYWVHGAGKFSLDKR